MHVVTRDFITYLMLKDRSYTYFPCNNIPYSIRNIIIDLNLINLIIIVIIIIIINNI